MSTNRGENIRRSLQAVYKPVVPRPEFKERLLKRLLKEMEEGKLLRSEADSAKH